MKTRYYVAHADASAPAVYLVEGEHLAHYTKDADWIDESEARVWSTASKSDANAVAKRFAAYGTSVRPYSVRG